MKKEKHHVRIIQHRKLKGKKKEFRIVNLSGGRISPIFKSEEKAIKYFFNSKNFLFCK